MSDFYKNLTEEQKESWDVVKSSLAWGVIRNLAHEIIVRECDLEAIPITLSDNEFKIENLARRKAKIMFTQIFEDIEGINNSMVKEKINYE